MFIAALFTAAKRGKQPKFPLPDEWISKMYTYITEYFSALKMKEILISATRWMNLEDIMLRNKQSHKDKYCVVLLIGTWNSKIHRDRMVVAGAGGNGEWESLFNRFRVSVLQDESVLEMIVVVMTAQYECAQCH